MAQSETTIESIVKRVGRDVAKNAPKVSIVTPAYNVAEFAAETLDSIFAQTYKDFEIILVNDGSPDTTEFERILEPYFDRIIYLKQTNAGAGAARNAGIEQARGELLAFLDGDDVWLPEYLESQTQFLEKNNFDLVYADAALFGGSTYDGKTFMQTAPSVGEANFDALLDLRCSIITSGTLARRRAVIAAGMFECERVHAEDFMLWLKMARNGSRIGYQREILLKYRVRRESLSGNSIERVERGINVFHRVGEVFPLGETQKNIIANQLQRFESDLEIERGKSFLLQEKFDSAVGAFTKANEYRRSSRLKIIIGLLRFAPRLFLKFYKSRRSGEIMFVPNDEKNDSSAFSKKNLKK
jgi:teichuronic acid biosynthesis glycosyltransferase TuaG